MMKYSIIIFLLLLCRIGSAQENQFHIKTVELCADPIDLSNDSLKQVLHDQINQIVKNLNHEIFKHNFSNDTLYCKNYNLNVVMLFTFTINNENKIEKYEVTSTNNCEYFNHQLINRIMKLEGEMLRFNQYENKFHMVVTIDKSTGLIEFFDIY